MKKKTLLILAAGMGSRFGGLKQIAPVGPNGEIIIEYSIYDALRAGFNKIVFVIRHYFEEAFREKLGHKFENCVETVYAYQELDSCLNGYPLPADREKPWGTGHAILVAKDLIDEPFAVINADDYYGVQAYRLIASHLDKMADGTTEDYAMVGYLLRNTLSEYGAVSRGLCRHDEQMFLISIQECTGIRKDNGGAMFVDEAGRTHRLTGLEYVSMNLWGLGADFFEFLQPQFDTYLRQYGTDPKREFYLPTAIDTLIRSGRKKVKILKTHDSWFGITYREDQAIAQAKIRQLIKEGVYPECLYSQKVKTK